MSQAAFPHAAESRTVLAANFRRYGRGPDFWGAYRRLLDSTAGVSEHKAEAANRLALLAEELGIVDRAQLL